MAISVCIGNYGYYNEGELHDAWIELPKKKEEIRKFLHEHKLWDPYHEEIYISDYDGYPFGLTYGKVFSEQTPLYLINILAALMEKYKDNTDIVQKALDCEYDAPESIIGLMNWIVQADEIPYHEYDLDGGYESMSDTEKFGLTCANGTSWWSALKSVGLQTYFDLDTYGEVQADNAYLGTEGYIDATEDMPPEDKLNENDLEALVSDMIH